MLLYHIFTGPIHLENNFFFQINDYDILIVVKEDDIMNLDQVLGIVLTPEGELYPFGKQNSDEAGKTSVKDSHGGSFMRDVVPTAWFQSLNYKFTPMDAFSHFNRLTDMGYGFFLNGSVISYPNICYHAYTVQMPYFMTDAQKEVLSQQYDYLSRLVDEEQADFYGQVLDAPTYVPITREVDDFYQSIGVLPKERITQK